MQFLHQEFSLDTGDIVEVMSDTQANVMVLTDLDFANYEAGRDYRYFGGFFTHFPARIPAPHAGHWHVVLDLGGGSALVRYSIRAVKAIKATRAPARLINDLSRYF